MCSKKLLVTSASLVVTSDLLIVTRTLLVQPAITSNGNSSGYLMST